MLRIFALLFLFSVVSALSGTLDDFIKNLSENNKPDQMHCSIIEGIGKGCYECYCCSDNGVQQRRDRGKTVTVFRLNDNNCNATAELCCFSQEDLGWRSKNDNCGISNPEGYPRAVRHALKSVLPGEYPWRAWIYSTSDPHVPICAAVFISLESRALITSAYYVEPYAAESLMVRFSKDQDIPYDVKSVIIHKHYSSATRFNDIAVIGLTDSKSLPAWVRPACMSETKALFAIPCVAVSGDDNYVNTVIPQQTACVGGGNPLDESFICTVAPKNDYEPEVGGALVCPERDVDMYYTAYGITLYRSGDSSIMIHTNVTHFFDWIEEQINTLAYIR